MEAMKLKQQEQQVMMQQANQQRLEQQKQQMEVMKAQQAALMLKRQEEQKKKEAEMQVKKLEAQAVLGIRRGIQKFKSCKQDNFEEFKKELETIMAAETENLKTPAAKERIMLECTQAITAKQQQFETMAAAKKKAEEERVKEMQRRKDALAKAGELMIELEALVEKAEKAGQGVVEEAEPLTTGDKPLSSEEIEACHSAVEQAAKEANEASKACTDFILKESQTMKAAVPLPGSEPSTVPADLQKLVLRTNESKKTVQATLVKAAQAKNSKIKMAAATEKRDKGLALITKYDADKDGKMSRKEIQAFSKGAYSFTLPAEVLDEICTRLIKDGSKGVEKAQFYKMRVMIGVAREAVIDKKKKAAREKREKELADMKEKLQESIKGAVEVVTKANEEFIALDKHLGTLPAKAKTMTATEMVAAADEADGMVEESRKNHKASAEAIAALNVETQPELKGYFLGECKKLEIQVKTQEAKIIKSSAQATKFRSDAAKKDGEEIAIIRKKALAMIRYHQGAKKLDNAGVFTEFDKKKKGAIDETQFLKFFSSCERKKNEEGEKEEADISEDDLSRLFANFDEEDENKISKEKFLSITRTFMKVLKSSVITDDISIKSAPTRRLVEDEVLEALTGPMMDDENTITRMKVKALSDGVEGWVTPVGNQGTVFMEEGGNVYKVVKDAVLTSSFVIGEGDGKADKKLKVGEVVEVIEFGKKEEASNCTRMKVRTKSANEVGWVTSVGNTGIEFLKLV